MYYGARQLYYYDDQKSAAEGLSRGVISLNGGVLRVGYIAVQNSKSHRWFSFKAEAEPPSSHIFSIETNNRVYKFACDSESDMLDWAKALSSAMRPEGELAKSILEANERSKEESTTTRSERMKRLTEMPGSVVRTAGQAIGLAASQEVTEEYLRDVPDVDPGFLQRGPPTHLLVHLHHLAGVPRLLGKGVAQGARITTSLMLADVAEESGHKYSDELRHSTPIPSRVVRACNGLPQLPMGYANLDAGDADPVPASGNTPTVAMVSASPPRAPNPAAAAAGVGGIGGAAAGSTDAADEAGAVAQAEAAAREEAGFVPDTMDLAEEGDDFDEDVCPVSATFSFMVPPSANTMGKQIPYMRIPESVRLRIAMRLNQGGSAVAIAQKRHLTIADLPSLDGMQLTPYKPLPIPLRIAPPQVHQRGRGSGDRR